MPEIEGIGHLVIDDGTRERDSVYIEHEGRMQVGIYYERPARERNDSYGWRIEAGLPESTLTIEFATASRAVLADLDTLRESGRRVQITFDFSSGQGPAAGYPTHQFYNCMMSSLNITPVDPGPGEEPRLIARIGLEFSVSMPVETRPQVVHPIFMDPQLFDARRGLGRVQLSPRSGRTVEETTREWAEEIRRANVAYDEIGMVAPPERSREFYKQGHEAKKRAKPRVKKPKALPPPKPLTMLEERFTRIAENLEREDKDGN